MRIERKQTRAATHLAVLALFAGCGAAPHVHTPVVVDAGAPAIEATPEVDGDHDGIAGDSDACPCAAEDVDGFEDADGCPDDDNDGDRIVDVCDRCPNESELYNGTCDEDGCPDRGPQILLGTDVRILDRVFFARGSDAVPSEALPFLDALATTLRANAWISVVAVEGRQERREPAGLAQRRAEAVRDALVARGIASTQLVAVGIAPSDPSQAGLDAAQRRSVGFEIRETDDTAPGSPHYLAPQPYDDCSPPACTFTPRATDCGGESRSDPLQSRVTNAPLTITPVASVAVPPVPVDPET